MSNDDNNPAEAIIVRDDGQPIGRINFDDLEANATLLMYAFADSAGDDDKTDEVAAQWLDRIGPGHFGYVAAAALALMTRNVLAPVLEVVERQGIDLRVGIREAYANALATL
jgi:hypothetical protein